MSLVLTTFEHLFMDHKIFYSTSPTLNVSYYRLSVSKQEGEMQIFCAIWCDGPDHIDVLRQGKAELRQTLGLQGYRSTHTSLGQC